MSLAIRLRTYGQFVLCRSLGISIKRSCAAGEARVFCMSQAVLEGKLSDYLGEKSAGLESLLRLGIEIVYIGHLCLKNG